MKKVLFLASLVLLAASCAPKQTLQDRLTVNDKQINEIIAQLSLEEKVEMLHSKTIMSSAGIERLGIADMHYADGPFGIREEVGDHFSPKGWTTDSATYFPTGSALAATWSKDMAYAYGHGMGVEGRYRGKDVILGPAINIQRIPVGGRTYEYLSEDPFLSGILATGFTLGSQDAGTAVCLKHFALNNQETNRGSVNVICDERTMREIYLKPFEMAVRDGGAMSVMPAYNKVNGFHCSENNHILNEILRADWGFKGFTVSDWGATHSTMGAALGGLNVQMTGDNYLGQPLIDSINAGKLPESIVDDKVREILRVRFAIEAIPDDQCNIEVASRPESREAAYQVATKSIVLLKNDNNVLPVNLDNVKKIAVIGRAAVTTTALGGVGAGVKAPYEITPLQGIQKFVGDKAEVVYADAYRNYAGRRANPDDPTSTQDIAEAPDAKLVAEAVATAKDADVVLYFVGTNRTIETEGSDRQNITLPVSQDLIGNAIAAVNPNIVTVIISGGPCDLQNIVTMSPAIVQGWWNGMEGGRALADVLFGKISPSGKLPFTFPIKLEDSPAYAMGNFPQKAPQEGDLFTNQYRNDLTGGQKAQQPRQRVTPDAIYSEGMLVGYRWFDTKNLPVMYAFGHGLSYVDFEYSNISTDKSSYKASGTIKVNFDLKNNGDMEADEVVQLYVHRLDSNVEWPYKELKAFERVTLAGGETRNVTLEIPVENLRYWNDEVNGWTLENGNIELLLGGASDDIRLSAEVAI